MKFDFIKNIFKRQVESPTTRNEFPLSQISPHRNQKLVFQNKDFKQLVKSELEPKLKALGFANVDYTFFRDCGSHYEIIFLGKTKYGGALSIDAAIKFKPPLSIDDTDFKNLWPFQDCESFERLSPDSDDNWWVFRDTIEENIAVISEMWALIQKFGLPYFKYFENLNYILGAIDIADIPTEKLYTKHKFVRQEARFYYSLIQNCILKHNFDKAIILAQTGLQMKQIEDKYKDYFEKFLQDQTKK